MESNAIDRASATDSRGTHQSANAELSTTCSPTATFFNHSRRRTQQRAHRLEWRAQLLNRFVSVLMATLFFLIPPTGFSSNNSPAIADGRFIESTKSQQTHRFYLYERAKVWIQDTYPVWSSCMEDPSLGPTDQRRTGYCSARTRLARRWGHPSCVRTTILSTC